MEATQLLKNQITKNIFELNEEQMNEWMKGNELNIQTGKKGFLAMKYQNDFLGCGKASENKISNFVPKERRIKERN
jgi:NOL1/NOP2/fmu family ribosome biogenesis protein